MEDLERQIDDNTAAIIVNNPSNPCGSVYSRQHLLDILAVAEKHRVPIISDDTYAGMVSIVRNQGPSPYPHNHKIESTVRYWHVE